MGEHWVGIVLEWESIGMGEYTSWDGIGMGGP